MRLVLQPSTAHLGNSRPLRCVCYPSAAFTLWQQSTHLPACCVQVPKEGAWSDELLVVHVSKGKEKDGKWDHGSAVIADLETSLQPWKHDVYDLEVSW